MMEHLAFFGVHSSVRQSMIAMSDDPSVDRERDPQLLRGSGQLRRFRRLQGGLLRTFYLEARSLEQ